MANTLKFGNGEWYGKKDTILAYNDENSNYKPLPFDFSRASKATVINKDGLIEEVGSGEPRIDYKNNTKGALLLEPSRSNALPYSNKFLNTGWQYYRGTITANATISPDGTLNASRYQEDSQTGSHLFRRQSLSITNGLSYTGSIFAKKGELTSLRLASNSNSRWVAGAEFNLENGTVTSGTGVIENYGNGWYRCSISGNAVQTTTVAGFEIYTSVGVGRDGDGLFMYGAMFEQGSYATSYIPTSGSVVTRLADECNNAGNEQVINSTEGVLYAEMSALTSFQVSTIMISLSNGGSSAIRFGYQQGTSVFFVESTGAANNIGIYSEPINSLIYSKIALSYKENDVKLYINGFLVATDSVFTPFTSNVLNKLSFDNGVGVSDFYGNVKDVRVYNTALTDQELIALTTI